MPTVVELKKSVKGLIIPIPAVFDGKGEPDLPMMEKLTDWYLGAGVHGFFILGSQGQGPATTIEQRKAIAETVIKRVNKRVPCIVQIGSNCGRKLQISSSGSSLAVHTTSSSTPCEAVSIQCKSSTTSTTGGPRLESRRMNLRSASRVRTPTSSDAGMAASAALADELPVTRLSR